MLFDPRDTLYAGGVVYFAANEHLDRGPDRPAEGTDGAIFALDAKDGKNLWSVRIPERTHQMAVAGGRLFVSTRQGAIYCYAPSGEQGRGVIDERVEPDPYPQPQDEEVRACRQAANRILASNDPNERGLGLDTAGYALVLDCDSGALAFSLAKRSDLYVCAVFDDAEKAQRARERFSRANLFCSRISVWTRPPGTVLPFSPNFADLIVSERAAIGGAMSEYTAELENLLKPIRGIALWGGKQEEKVVQQWSAAAKIGAWKTREQHEMRWAVHVRPPVTNGGGWTHANGNPGNTMCSHDSALKPPLGIVWYGPPYSKSTLGRPPLVHNGVLVCPIDENTIEGYDSYNGRRLWSYAVPKFGSRTADRNIRMMAAGGDSLFIPDGSVEQGKRNQGVVRLDLWTGKVVGGYPSPFPEMRMGHFALSRDGKTFWRSGYGDKTETQGDWTCMYAVDTESGKVLWTAGGPGKEKPFGLYRERVPYEKWSAMGDGRIYIMRVSPSAEQIAQLDADTKAYLQQNDPESFRNFEQLPRQIKRFVAVDAMTGNILYDRAVDVQDCDNYVAAHNGKVLFLSNSGEKWWGGFGGGAFKNTSIAVHDAATGKFLWKRKCNYRFEPVITDKVIYAEPWAFELATGRRLQRPHPVTAAKGDFTWVRHDKQCGGYSGSTHFLFGRNKGFGYHDVLRDHGMYQTWHHRQACEPDTSSGGGMMLKPPFNIGCGCPWSLPYTIAMANISTEPAIPFRFFQSGRSLPVNELRINFGASGDRKDKAGNMWFNPVREGHPSKLQLTLAPMMTFHSTGEKSPGSSTKYGRRSASDIAAENTPDPFLFDAYAFGLKKCIVPVTTPGDGKGTYTVRLGFSALAADRPGLRVFDVRLNGKTVLKDFDIVKEAGKAHRAVWKEFTVAVDGNLELDLVTRAGDSAEVQVPLINAMEVIRKEITSLGFKAASSVWVNEETPETTVDVHVANHQNAPFTGKLAVEAGGGIVATPADVIPFTLRPGEHRNIQVHLKNGEPAKTGSHRLALKLLSAAGKVEHQHALTVDCLGKLHRRSLTGTGRWCMTRETYETWINRSVPPHYVGRFPASLGALKTGDSGAACSWMRFGVPREIGAIHRVRMRLHVSPELAACWHSLYGSETPAVPRSNYWGVLRMLESPTHVEVNPLNYPELPKLLPARHALLPSASNPNVVEAALPTAVARNENGEGLVQII
ncbi:MAG: PQQ-binding-like beta-propeller repeat protein, partial [Pirellulales bacterium]